MDLIVWSGACTLRLVHVHWDIYTGKHTYINTSKTFFAKVVVPQIICVYLRADKLRSTTGHLHYLSWTVFLIDIKYIFQKVHTYTNENAESKHTSNINLFWRGLCRSANKITYMSIPFQYCPHYYTFRSKKIIYNHLYVWKYVLVEDIDNWTLSYSLVNIYRNRQK